MRRAAPNFPELPGPSPALRTNALERVNRGIGRRTDVFGIILPNERGRIRLSASVVIEQSDEWLVGRYLSAHSLEPLLAGEGRSGREKTEEEVLALTAA